MTDSQKEQQRRDEDFDETSRQLRPQLHRVSSGIEEDAAGQAILPFNTNQQQNVSHEEPDDIRRWSKDSGLDSPQILKSYQYPPESGKGNGNMSANSISHIPEGHEKHKRVMDELHSKMKISRSQSQSDIDVKNLYGPTYNADDRKEKPTPPPRFRKNVKQTPEHDSTPASTSITEPVNRRARPPLTRSRTLPSTSGRGFGDSSNVYVDNDADEKQIGTSEKGTDRDNEIGFPKRLPLEKEKKSKTSSLKSHFTKGVSHLTRSVSTRLSSKPKKLYHEKQMALVVKENISDSESHESIKPLSMQKAARFSRSLDDLDGYDYVESSGFTAPRFPKSATDLPFGTYEDEHSHYEVLEIQNTISEKDEREKRYSKFSEVGFIQVDGDGSNMSNLALDERRPIVPKEYGISKTKSEAVRDKPIPKPRQHRHEQPPVSKPSKPKQPTPTPTGPLPLPPPGANENRKMAERVIQDFIAKDPQADITEIVIQTSNFVAKYCDENGGYLEVGSKMVALFVPPYAIDEKSSTKYPTLIYVQIEESQGFMEQHHGHQIAPVIHCGTPGTKFRSPVILTLLTTVQDAKHLEVTGLRKDNVTGEEEKDWRKTTKEDGKVVSLEKGKCTMMMHHFTKDTLAAEPVAQSDGKKHFAQVKMMAFTSPMMKSDKIFDIRLWMNSNEDKQLQDQKREIEVNHAKRLGHLDLTLNLFKDGGDLNIEVTKLNSGWCKAYPESDLKEIISIDKLHYNHKHDGIRESRAFYIRPTQSFRTNEAVNFEIALFQTDKQDHGEKLHVHVIPELDQEREDCRPGQCQPFTVFRQRSDWKPSERSLHKLKQSLTIENKWRTLAAWLRLDFKVLEAFPCPVSGMLSMLYMKHARSRDNIRRGIEELEEPLDKLGSDLQEASTIVKEMLGKKTQSQADLGAGDVRYPYPTEESWPQRISHSPIQVNDYRFVYNCPREYHTLRSDGGQFPVVTSEVQDVPQGATALNVNPHQIFYQEGQPRTLSSNISVSTPRSAPVAVQQNWPQEENHNYVNDHGAREDEDPINIASNMVPRGLQHRKSSGYATIPYDIDPNRPQAQLPDAPEYHYDQPNSPQGIVANTENECTNHDDDQAYEGVAIAPDEVESDLMAIARGEPEPPYVNVLQRNKPGKTGYLKNVPNSKAQH